MALSLNQAVNISYGVSSLITLVGGVAACRTSNTTFKILSVGAFVFGVGMFDGTYHSSPSPSESIFTAKKKLINDQKVKPFYENMKQNAKSCAVASVAAMALMTTVHMGLCAYKKYFV